MPDRVHTSAAGFTFAVSSLLPAVLLIPAALAGGLWVWAALGYITFFVFVIDERLAVAPPQPGAVFRAHRLLTIALALVHFGVLFLVVHGLASDGLSGARKIGLFLATGLFFGQVSNSNAHELIHTSRRALFGLGKWVYISMLFGHHVSSHRLVHHVHVATPQDPNTARKGERYYRFLARSWIGSFRAGLAAESARDRKGALHPYLVYAVGAALCLAISAVIAGGMGVVAHVCLALFAQSQLLLSDYVQHYGLTRGVRSDGSFHPAGLQHSWNAPHWLSGRMMLFAPRHSDHHLHPSRPFPELTLPAADRAPMLPRSLPAMACLALLPPVWRRVMDPRVARWVDQGKWRHAAE